MLGNDELHMLPKHILVFRGVNQICTQKKNLFIILKKRKKKLKPRTSSFTFIGSFFSSNTTTIFEYLSFSIFVHPSLVLVRSRCTTGCRSTIRRDEPSGCFLAELSQKFKHISFFKLFRINQFSILD